MILGPVDQLLGELDYYELEAVTEKVNTSLKGKTISSLDFEWNWYQKMNEDFELEDELNYAPLGVIINFDAGESLQLASIKFQINTEDKSIAKINYLPEGDLLVALNEVLPIILEDDEMQ